MLRTQTYIRYIHDELMIYIYVRTYDTRYDYIFVSAKI